MRKNKILDNRRQTIEMQILQKNICGKKQSLWHFKYLINYELRNPLIPLSLTLFKIDLLRNNFRNEIFRF